jgi:4-hydroxybenzoate polyprenyltransferase
MNLVHHNKIRTLGLILECARFFRPTGTVLLLMPCLWGLCCASKGQMPLRETIVFFFGAFFMRSAGCIYNDWIDQDIDHQVLRTCHRPLASKKLSPLTAWLALGLFCTGGLFVLMQLTLSSIVLGVVSFFLILPYPFLKRWTYWPQVFLGLIFNLGVFFAYSQWYTNVLQPIDFLKNCPTIYAKALYQASPLLLYLIGVLWTIAYDTVYGYQDLEDDLAANIKSSPTFLQHRGKKFLWGVFFLRQILFLGLSFYEGFFQGCPGVLGLGTCVWTLGEGFFLKQLNVYSPHQCKKFFSMVPFLQIAVLGFLQLLYAMSC